MSSAKSVSPSLLRQFQPLCDMKRDSLTALAAKLSVLRVDRGRAVMREADRARRVFWLLAGSVELRRAEQSLGRIDSDTPQGRLPLGSTQTEPCSAVALTEVRYLSVDRELLDVMLTWDRTGVYEVTELRQRLSVSADDVNDWMTLLLQNPALQRVPAANIQAIFKRMQRRDCRAGEVVVRQEGDGDFFYTIVTGRCEVLRTGQVSDTLYRLATLGPGQGFGEDALISGGRRNATVRMLTDGVLMRLACEDFRQLLAEPLVQRVDLAAGRQIVADGGQWIDLRPPLVFRSAAIEGAINIPLQLLRMRLAGLDRDRRHVLYSDVETASLTGSFILQEAGLEAFVLEGGLQQGLPDLAGAA
ncbi:MAG: hypothetical protein RL026_2638 [Pseudomonadota bacterium]|jgi:CRP-like cAMP-binding protein